MGGACTTHEGWRNSYKSFGKKKNLKRRGHFVDFRKDSREILYGRVKWIHLTQDMIQSEAFINL
jgi:hypothetical protein